MFVVASPFEAAGVHFKEGDLLQYLRKERGRDFIAALQFRHLRKLPGAEGTPRPISKEENAAAVKWMAERVIEVKGSKETP